MGVSCFRLAPSTSGLAPLPVPDRLCVSDVACPLCNVRSGGVRDDLSFVVTWSLCAARLLASVSAEDA
eukprot:4510512-Pleurochrysis_carterae.AAC.1